MSVSSCSSAEVEAVGGRQPGRIQGFPDAIGYRGMTVILREAKRWGERKRAGRRYGLGRRDATPFPNGRRARPESCQDGQAALTWPRGPSGQRAGSPSLARRHGLRRLHGRGGADGPLGRCPFLPLDAESVSEDSSESTRNTRDDSSLLVGTLRPRAMYAPWVLRNTQQICADLR